MAIDIRMPIGLMFLILGGLLVAFGAVTHFSNPSIYARSLDININIWWGLAMIAFGAPMYYYGTRRRGESKTATEGQRPEAERSDPLGG